MIKYSKGIALALLIAAVFCLLPGCGGKSAGGLAAIQDKGVLTVATSPDFPPFESLENGKVAGIEVDILEKVAESLGVTLQIEQMDFESVIPGVQAGKFDVGMSGITITEKRKENVDFSEPYFLAAQTIVVPAGSGISCKADLDGKKISVQTGTTAEEYCMENGYDVLAFTSNNDAAAALTGGKVDAWVVDNEVAVAMAGPLGLVTLEEAMTTEPYAFAFAKGSDELVAAVNAALDEMLADGTVADIFAAWGVSYVAP